MATQHTLIEGRVQGVGFRWFVRARATELALHVWCANLPDGSVEVWLDGEPQALEQMASELRRGPSAARVTRVQGVVDQPLTAIAHISARVAF